jgi:hypothetical protein
MAFDLQPTLRGKLVALRPLRAEDFNDLFAVAADAFLQRPLLMLTCAELAERTG